MLKKQHLKSRPVCKVTFYLQPENGAESVHLVGDFNDWDKSATAMEKLKDGRYKTLLELEQGKEYQFLYLVNGTEWVNDPDADEQVPNPYSGLNSVVNVNV